MPAPVARRRPTIDDVAKEAGVSRGTVSRVLNGGHWVSPDALVAVNAAIKRTGYRVNPHARSLATSRAHSVAFLLTETHDRLFEDPNFSVLVRGATTALAALDLSLVLIMAGTADEQRRASEFIGAGHVDGVLLVSAHRGGKSIIADIIESGIPAIACGMPLGLERRMGYVTVDEEDGARQMTSYLRGIGRTRIGTIAGPQDTAGGIGRLKGFRDEMGADLVEERVAYGDYSRDSGARAMRELLERDPQIDAVFVASDLMGAGAIAALHAAGRRIPEDVAVGGFDDSPIATSVDPALTTMRQPFERIAQEMVRLLVQLIEGERPAVISLPSELVVRAST
jgi:DNA-binding LacI/PurR family transcriptional regulator